MANYESRIQWTIDHIEENLTETITLSELAGIACFSEFHYHKVFLAMVGDSVMEYVRKRRLAQAAYQVAHTEGKILDIALDHGFQNHETFTRAFKKLFCLNPAEYRKRGIHTPRYTKANLLQRRFNPYLGGIQMEFRMETKPEFTVIGYALNTNNKGGRNHREIPAFWLDYIQKGLGCAIPNRVHQDETIELGICTDFNMETGDFVYIIGMEAKHFDNVPDSMVCRTFPEQTYVVFTTPLVKADEFTSSIQSTWRSIYSEWFPHSGYEHAGSPAEFEWYDKRCQDPNGLQQMGIYIPVIKKSEEY